VSQPLDDRAPASTAVHREAHHAARHDWPAQAADQVVNVVDTVRQKTTGPALTVARAVVYGFLILIAGIAALVLLIAAIVRFGAYWVPVWSVYLGLGTFLVLVGAVLYRLRAPKPAVGNQTAGANG
jgi:hypothetical protein